MNNIYDICVVFSCILNDKFIWNYVWKKIRTIYMKSVWYLVAFWMINVSGIMFGLIYEQYIYTKDKWNSIIITLKINNN